VLFALEAKRFGEIWICPDSRRLECAAAAINKRAKARMAQARRAEAVGL
jgi:hypothetical protein